MLGGGADRSWLEPVDHEGNREGVTGSHTGPSEILNIDNAQPGFGYLWAKNDAASIRSEMRRGYAVVNANDPEMANIQHLSGSNVATIDSTKLVGDVILMRIPTEQLRKIRDAESQRARAMLRSGSDEFLQRVTQAEAELDPRGRGTRFSESTHRMTVRGGSEDDAAVLDEWSPEHGILK